MLLRALLNVVLLFAVAAISFYAGRATAPEPRTASAIQMAPPPPQSGTATRTRIVETPRAIGLPIAGLKRSDIHDTFEQSRGDGERRHEATDILAPRGTPVVAVDTGVIKKLFNSKPGGLTIYQFDSTGSFCYYYAHLDGYAEGLREGMLVKRGETIGYVGSTGNANPATPHLHFAIFELGPEKRWWEGKPINPYPILMQAFE